MAPAFKIEPEYQNNNKLLKDRFVDQYRASRSGDFRKKWRFWRFGEVRSEMAITSKISLKSKNQDHFYTNNF